PERWPNNRAGKTLLLLRTSTSPDFRRSGKSRKYSSRNSPLFRFSTSMREAARSASGSCAMSSRGRWKSNSETSTESSYHRGRGGHSGIRENDLPQRTREDPEEIGTIASTF